MLITEVTGETIEEMKRREAITEREKGKEKKGKCEKRGEECELAKAVRQRSCLELLCIKFSKEVLSVMKSVINNEDNADRDKDAMWRLCDNGTMEVLSVVRTAIGQTRVLSASSSSLCSS